MSDSVADNDPKVLCISVVVMHSTIGSLSATESDLVNHDFLHMFKTMYSQDVLNNLSFDYFTSDSFNDITNSYESLA